MAAARVGAAVGMPVEMWWPPPNPAGFGGGSGQGQAPACQTSNYASVGRSFTMMRGELVGACPRTLASRTPRTISGPLEADDAGMDTPR